MSAAVMPNIYMSSMYNVSFVNAKKDIEVTPRDALCHVTPRAAVWEPGFGTRSVFFIEILCQSGRYREFVNEFSFAVFHRVGMKHHPVASRAFCIKAEFGHFGKVVVYARRADVNADAAGGGLSLVERDENPHGFSVKCAVGDNATVKIRGEYGG